MVTINPSVNDRSTQARLPGRSPRSSRRFGWASLWLGVTSALLTTMPVRAAEQIVFTYNQLEFTLPVSSLNTFVTEGKVDKDLAYYFRMLKPEAQEKLRKALQSSRKKAPFPVSQVLYSPMGESALQNLGYLFQTGPDQNGFYALRSAIIQAAADPEGATLLGIITHFPAKTLRIDIPLVLQIADRWSKLKTVPLLR